MRFYRSESSFSLHTEMDCDVVMRWCRWWRASRASCVSGCSVSSVCARCSRVTQWTCAGARTTPDRWWTSGSRRTWTCARASRRPATTRAGSSTARSCLRTPSPSPASAKTSPTSHRSQHFHPRHFASAFIHWRIADRHTHTRLTALCPGLSRWAGKPIWILLEQQTVSDSGISWAICKSTHHSRQITTPAPHHSVFYRPDALPAAQPAASKHWRRIGR